MEHNFEAMMLSPLNRLTLGLGPKTEKASYKEKKKQLCLSSSSRQLSNEPSPFRLTPTNLLYHKPSSQNKKLFNMNHSSKNIQSVIISNQSKLSAFNSLIDEIYKSDINSTPNHNNHSKRKPNLIKTYYSNGKSKHSKYFSLFSPSCIPKSANHVNIKQYNHFCVIKNDNAGSSKLGNLSKYFSSFKLELNKKKTKMTNLVNNITRAHAMNEKWLKSYVVKLKCKESKYFNMPEIKFDHYDL